MAIDFRSDTVTKPTPAMRAAMAAADVGDDVYGEDPTVNRLEALAAGMLGKEAALFVASGTMGNLLATLTHCPRGAEVILGDESHIYHYEQGGASAVGSLVFHPVPTGRFGELNPDAIRHAIRDRNNVHFAAPGVICLENTHNRCGGTILSMDYVRRVRAIADEAKVPMHLDGARLAHASVATGIPLADLARPFDSVQFDLSKALGAPVGGVVAGSKEFIRLARRGRKMLGGGMRQAGIIAAAGVIAMEQMIDRLAEDHAKARRIAERLSQRPELGIELDTVQTNIVRIDVKAPWTAAGLIASLKAQGVLAGSPRHDRIRFVTHYDVSDEQVDEALAIVNRVLDVGPPT